MKHEISYYVETYFSEYLPKQLASSKNTIMSYSKTIMQLINFMNDKKIKFKFENITFKVIEEFLNYLETEKNISISTRNQKLACIHSLFKYIQKRELSYFNTCKQILDIKNKKQPTTFVSYMSVEEVQILLSIPKINSKEEYRDFVILSLMYETGARVQEILDLKVNNLRISEYSAIELIGKGNKARLVPIGNNIKNILLKYLSEFSIINSNEYLFKNKYGNQLTRKGIQYIIDKYVEKARVKEPKLFNKKISPHTFRHSKAMHLLEAGVNLIYIRDILGHVSVTTTEIYARTNPKIKKEIIEKNSKALNIKSKYSKKEKSELINFLNEFSK